MEIVFENDGHQHLKTLAAHNGVTETPAGVQVLMAGYPAVRRLLQQAQDGGWVLGVKFANGQGVNGRVRWFGLDHFELEPAAKDGQPAGFGTQVYLTAVDQLRVF
jgi:hypothetical protein